MPSAIQYVPRPPQSGFKPLLTEPVAVPAMGTTAVVLAANAAGITTALQAALRQRLAQGIPGDGKPAGRLLYTVDEIRPATAGSTAKITVWYETI